MTARGELFIDEDCRDFFTKELDAVFGEDTWILDGSQYSNFQDESELPRECSIPIRMREEQDVFLGRADIEIGFDIEHFPSGEKYIYATPQSIDIVKCSTDDKICMQCPDQHSRTLHTPKGCCVCKCRMVNLDGI